MPRVYVPDYPEVPYTFQEFPKSVKCMHDYKQRYWGADDATFVKLWQEWGIIHTICPRAMCKKYNVECYYNGARDCVRCPQCRTEYPARPMALKYLEGSHCDLFKQIYYFCSEMPITAVQNMTGYGVSKTRLFRKRAQAVVITGLAADRDQMKLGGDLEENPLTHDDCQKGAARKGNGAQASRPTMVHGAISTIADNKFHVFSNSLVI